MWRLDLPASSLRTRRASRSARFAYLREARTLRWAARMPKNIRVPFSQRCPTSDPILADAITDDIATSVMPRDLLDQLGHVDGERSILCLREEPLFLDGTSLQSRRTFVRDQGPRRRGRVRGAGR